MNAPIHNADALRRALAAHVVDSPQGKRPHLEITTPQETFLLVAVQEPVLSRKEGDELAFVSFEGKDPMGRTRLFIWPADGVEAPALPITNVSVYA